MDIRLISEQVQISEHKLAMHRFEKVFGFN